MPRKRTLEELNWNIDFGARLERARNRLRLSQEQLGQRLSWADGQQTVSKYELGASTPSPFRLIALAGALEIGLFELLGDASAFELAEPTAAFRDFDDELRELSRTLTASDRQQVLDLVRRLAAEHQ